MRPKINCSSAMCWMYLIIAKLNSQFLTSFCMPCLFILTRKGCNLNINVTGEEKSILFHSSSFYLLVISSNYWFYCLATTQTKLANKSVSEDCSCVVNFSQSFELELRKLRKSQSSITLMDWIQVLAQVSPMVKCLCLMKLPRSVH